MSNEIEIWKNKSPESLNGEEWRDVVGYEGLYQVSNLGRVRSLDRIVKNTRGCSYAVYGAIKSQYLHKGYPMTSIYKNNIKNNSNVYRLVAFAFIPNPENKPEVNHIDGVKTNSRVSNLEWCTSSENSYHAYHTGLSTAPVLKGSAHGMTKLTEADVLEIRRLHATGMKHKDLRAKFGLGKSPLCRIVARKSWKHI